ncbi:MAG: TraV family lipoprotein [Alphaproteobacteria bacterium]|nr:TraV family lipoprotein [Alphaproteobacteria bacterium]MBS4049387.1 TraV family lipoprotein [Alphaproteobacteria bacterium]
MRSAFKIAALLAVALGTAGCSTWSRNVSGDWDCPAPQGLGCMTISEADRGRPSGNVETSAPIPVAEVVDSSATETAAAPAVTNPSTEAQTPAIFTKAFWSKVFAPKATTTEQVRVADPAGMETIERAPQPQAAAADKTVVATQPPVPVMPAPAPEPVLAARKTEEIMMVSAAPAAAGVRGNTLAIGATDIQGDRVNWTDRVRQPERLGRLWLNPYVDGSGNLHDGGFIFFVVSPARWKVE